MKIDILTLFPKMFEGPFSESIIRRAINNNLIQIEIHNLRKWTKDKRKTVDDRPFGGGAGMIMKVDIIDAALQEIKKKNSKIILLDAGGKKFDQKKALQLSKAKHLILVSGHYEGVDYRVHQYLADEIISIGDYILTGGELPAMVITDAVIRLIPGVIKPKSLIEESFSLPKGQKLKTMTEYPQYTRPTEYKGWKVPEILLTGNHKEIEEWRKRESGKKAQKLRPDLIK